MIVLEYNRFTNIDTLRYLCVKYGNWEGSFKGVSTQELINHLDLYSGIKRRRTDTESFHN